MDNPSNYGFSGGTRQFQSPFLQNTDSLYTTFDDKISLILSAIYLVAPILLRENSSLELLENIHENGFPKFFAEYAKNVYQNRLNFHN